MSQRIFIRELSSSPLTRVLFPLICGLIMLIFPGGIIRTVGYLVGVGFFVVGLICLVYYFRAGGGHTRDLATGGVLVVLGLYFGINNTVALSLFAIIFGILMMISGAVGIEASLNARKQNRADWKVSFPFALITTILGVVILFNPFGTIQTLIRYSGICLLVGAIGHLLMLLLYNKRMKRVNWWKIW